MQFAKIKKKFISIIMPHKNLNALNPVQDIPPLSQFHLSIAALGLSRTLMFINKVIVAS